MKMHSLTVGDTYGNQLHKGAFFIYFFGVIAFIEIKSR